MIKESVVISHALSPLHTVASSFSQTNLPQKEYLYISYYFADKKNEYFNNKKINIPTDIQVPFIYTVWTEAQL